MEPLCTINDILVKRLPLGGLEIGDVLVFEQAGAYCMTEGIALFLSRDLPGGGPVHPGRAGRSGLGPPGHPSPEYPQSSKRSGIYGKTD